MDLRAFAFGIAIGVVLLYAMLVVISSRVPEREDYRAIRWSALTGAAGILCNMLQGLVHPLIPFALGNALLVASGGLSWAGLRVLGGRSTPHWPVTVGVLLTLVVGVLYGWLAQDLSIRVFWVSAALSAYLLLIIGTLPALERVGIDRALLGYLRVVAVLFAIVTMIRALAAIWPADPIGLVAGSSILDPQLPISAGFLIVMLVLFALLVTGLNMLVVARLVDSTLNLARRDVLTGTLNRLGLRHLIDGWEHRPVRTVSLLAIDIDHFKSVNDQYGHEVGDRVLQQVVQCIRQAMRPEDALIRMGGEEFLLIAVERSPAATRELADRLLRTIAMPVRDLPLVTCSIGLVTHCQTRRTSFRAALQRADAALYRAKREGRNRVCEAD